MYVKGNSLFMHVQWRRMTKRRHWRIDGEYSRIRFCSQAYVYLMETLDKCFDANVAQKCTFGGYSRLKIRTSRSVRYVVKMKQFHSYWLTNLWLMCVSAAAARFRGTVTAPKVVVTTVGVPRHLDPGNTLFNHLSVVGHLEKRIEFVR